MSRATSRPSLLQGSAVPWCLLARRLCPDRCRPAPSNPSARERQRRRRRPFWSRSQRKRRSRWRSQL
eukprot:1165820-Alexandrium_andersonii.AAC.1